MKLSQTLDAESAYAMALRRRHSMTIICPGPSNCFSESPQDLPKTFQLLAARKPALDLNTAESICSLVHPAITEGLIPIGWRAEKRRALVRARRFSAGGRILCYSGVTNM